VELLLTDAANGETLQTALCVRGTSTIAFAKDSSNIAQLAQGLLRLMLRDLRLASAPPRSGHNAFQVAMQVRVDECAWMG